MIAAGNVLRVITKHYKLAAFLIVAALAVYFYLMNQKNVTRADHAENGRDAVVLISNLHKKEATRYKNKFDNEVVKVKSIEIERDQLKHAAKLKELDFLKGFGGLKKDFKNLESAHTFTTSLKDSLLNALAMRPTTIPCDGDSIKAFTYQYLDDWNNIVAVVLDTPKVECRDRYLVALEINRTEKWFWKGLKKFNWKNQWEPFGEVYNKNKLITIDSAAVFKIRR